MLVSSIVIFTPLLSLVHAWGSPFYYSSPGCNSPGFDLDSTGHINRTINGRRYLLHIPPEYDNQEAQPLVLSFHGGEPKPT